ncbi:MAG: amino acid decarboxylase, partial [Anaerotignum sp.]|nr:amino acid decarboxylase [Anaerotignum sp.]
MDITEIRGADELYAAEGIIAESEANAGSLFGFGKTVYGTEGSSQCIRAMLFLALQGAERTGERPIVLTARNAHKAFLYSCALMDLDVEWLMPAEGVSLCTCPITAEQVEEKLMEMAQKPFAVYITAPDYLGYSPDIKAIAAVCKKAGIPLLVDHAHGAYLKFLNPSRHVIDLGAAMCCDSAHKTLPVLTGGAYLHLSEEWAEKAGGQVKKAMEIFGSTSPSYLILQSLDKCNEYLSDGYPEKLAAVVEKLDAVKTFLRKQGWEIMDGDPLKLTIITGSMGYTGMEAAEVLRKNGVECEFADLDAVVLMATPENTDRDFEKVISALSSLPRKDAIKGVQMPMVLPERKMKI